VFSQLFFTNVPKGISTVGYEVLTVVVMKNSIFQDMSQNPLKVGEHFGEIYHLHLQG
jgi:hypothetical protein